MIKATIIALFVFFAIAYAQQADCPGRTCVASGNSCKQTSDTQYLICTRGTYCLSNADGTAATCTPALAIGALCNGTANGRDDACAGDFSFCDSTGKNPTNRCTNQIFNIGSGQPCGSNRNCANGFFCKYADDGNSASCTALLARDADCSGTNAQGCPANQVCSVGKCINVFSLQRDAACADSAGFDCAAGLWCNAGKCRPAASGSGGCASLAVPAQTCPTDSVCSCNTPNNKDFTATNGTCSTPITYSAAQTSTISNMLDCLQRNTCNGEGIFSIGGTPCNACKSQICSSIRIINRKTSFDNYCGYTDFSAQLERQFCGAAATVMVSFAAVAVAFFALFM